MSFDVSLDCFAEVFIAALGLAGSSFIASSASSRASSEVIGGQIEASKQREAYAR